VLSILLCLSLYDFVDSTAACATARRDARDLRNSVLLSVVPFTRLLSETKMMTALLLHAIY